MNDPEYHIETLRFTQGRSLIRQRRRARSPFTAPPPTVSKTPDTAQTFSPTGNMETSMPD